MTRLGRRNLGLGISNGFRQFVMAWRGFDDRRGFLKRLMIHFLDGRRQCFNGSVRFGCRDWCVGRSIGTNELARGNLKPCGGRRFRGGLGGCLGGLPCSTSRAPGWCGEGTGGRGLGSRFVRRSGSVRFRTVLQLSSYARSGWRLCWVRRPVALPLALTLGAFTVCTIRARKGEDEDHDGRIDRDQRW